MTDFRDVNDFFLFCSISYRFWHAYVCGWLFGIRSISWPTFHATVKKQECHLSELQGRVNNLEARQEQFIVQRPLPLAPMVGKGPGDQSMEE